MGGRTLTWAIVCLAVLFVGGVASADPAGQGPGGGLPACQANLAAGTIARDCPLPGARVERDAPGEVLLAQRVGAGRGYPRFAAARWTGYHSCARKFPATATLGAAFRHQLTSGCWACPRGYGRSIDPNIHGRGACAKGLSFRPARSVGTWGCAQGSFQNGLDDSCYSCPRGYNRTAVIGKDLTKMPRACERRD